MCTRCYETYIVHRLNRHCLVSYDLLPVEKIQEQISTPRELLPNFAYGKASEYMAWVFNEVLTGDTEVYGAYQIPKANRVLQP